MGPGGGGVGPGGGGVGNGPGGAGVGVAGAGVGFCGAGVGTWHFWSPQLEHLQSLCPLSETHWSLQPLGVWSEHLLVFQHQHLRCFLQSRQLSAESSAKPASTKQPKQHRKALTASSWIRRILVGNAADSAGRRVISAKTGRRPCGVGGGRRDTWAMFHCMFG